MSTGSVLDRWKKQQGGQSRRIEAAPAEATILTTSGQRRLWLLQQLYPDNIFYQYAHLYRIKGKVEVERLSQAIDELVTRHEILRCGFQEAGSELHLQARSPAAGLLRVETKLNEQALIEEIALEPYDLAESPLFRAALLPKADKEYLFVIGMHHIIGDRSSLQLLEAELWRIYQSQPSNTVTTASPEISFSDYAYWRSQQAPKETDRSYWHQQLAGPIPSLELPIDFSRPAALSFAGATIKQSLNPSVSEAVRTQARQLGVTANVYLLAAYQVWLSLYAREADISVGSPVSMRDRKQLEQLVGFMNETLVFRTELPPEISWSEAVERTNKTFLAGLSHKNYPFEQLVDDLQPERNPGRNPFFQHMFVYAERGDKSGLPHGWQLTDEMYRLPTAKFELTLFAGESETGFELALEYATDLFEPDSAERMLCHLITMLTYAVGRPKTKLGELPLLPPKEEERVIKDWNQTEQDFDLPPTVVDLIYLAGQQQPEAIAVTGVDGQITYGQLLTGANKLAGQLNTLSIKPGEHIGLCLERGPDLFIGLLGILAAGGAYVPLDPSYPSERLARIATDAGLSKVVTASESAPHVFLDQYQLVPVEKPRQTGELKQPGVLSPDSPAYLIYTSGSTGRPKGVVISHANLLHSTAARYTFYQQQPGVFLLLSSFSFDSSVAGIFWTLCRGGSLLVPPAGSEQDIAGLGEWFQRYRVTHSLMLPSLYQLLLDFVPMNQLLDLRTIMVAGEACPPSLVANHFERLPAVDFVNEYGPTEGTVWSTAHQITPPDAESPSLPIGRPIPNVTNYVLSPGLRALPPGVVGELYIGGAGISTGYWQQPELSAERFISDPFSEHVGARLYRTGDLARYRKDGLIEFLGRADRQVKIRGYRVEPDELRVVLAGYPGISEAAIKVERAMGSPRLLAYFTSKENKPIELLPLRAYLRNNLPDYMQPQAIQALPELPRLPNGKLNLAALPQPADQLDADFQARPPQTETERKLAAIWAGVLGVSEVQASDDFFALGGDSLQSIRLIGQAKRQGIELSPTLLFRYPVLADLARNLDRKDTPKSLTRDQQLYDPIVPLKTSGESPPLFCFHSGGGHVFFYRPLAENLREDRPLYAIQPPGLDGAPQPFSSIEEMTSYYLEEIRKVQPRGPYHFLGTCFSNAVCLELAKRLEDAGDEIGLFLIVDSGPPHHNSPDTLNEGPKPTRNFLKMLWSGEFRTIYVKIRNRLIWRYRDYQSEQSAEKRHLFQTIKSLNRMYEAYEPKSVAAPIHFIRSEEFRQRADKDQHLTRWKALTQGGLSVHFIPGTHVGLFSQPEVENLAEVINELLS